jgi:phosphohistidine phosphatase
MAEPTLILMRHAKSSWDNESLADFDRPLNQRGKRAAKQMAEYLAEKNQIPARVISSSSCRTRETVAIMQQVWSFDQERIRWLDSLYLATAHQIAHTICESWENKLTMYVGHNPGMEVFCSQLAAQTIEMPTAAICMFRWHQKHNSVTVDDIQAKNFELLSYATPKSLED